MSCSHQHQCAVSERGGKGREEEGDGGKEGFMVKL